jgi:hypothetical protein
MFLDSGTTNKTMTQQHVTTTTNNSLYETTTTTMMMVNLWYVFHYFLFCQLIILVGSYLGTPLPYISFFFGLDHKSDHMTIILPSIEIQ